jgi:hypothetical protein
MKRVTTSDMALAAAYLGRSLAKFSFFRFFSSVWNVFNRMQVQTECYAVGLLGLILKYAVMLFISTPIFSRLKKSLGSYVEHFILDCFVSVFKFSFVTFFYKLLQVLSVGIQYRQ